MTIDAVLAHVDDNLDAALERLKALVRIPSVSTDPAFKDHCQSAADWLAADLASLGIGAEARKTPGHPMVVGHVGDGRPHLMFYGHYDVQPVDPLELWHHDPFDPIVEDTPAGSVIRARGACDDKGQLMTFVEACRAWKAVKGDWPCRLSFIFEGEEESGSASLVPFLETHAEELSQPDLALICDTGLFDRDTPAITTMLRGLLGEEVTVTGPDKDLHSGTYGGAAINPIRVLARIIASLHDENGRITVPGFYDGVDELPASIRAQWEGLGFDADGFLKGVDLSEPAGESGRSVLEMIWSRPTCEVNGISGGYTGDGFKTVLPSKTSAKISFRLVGDQDPVAIRKSFRAMVRDALPPDCSVEFAGHGAAPASVMSTDDPAFEAARRALSDEWPNDAAFVGSGGSIPIAGYFREILGLPSMLIGFGLDDDQIHSPNEKYDLRSFHKGTRSWVRVLDALSR
ncbi:MAG: M20/M25/M40 family metallo-hydrolase [Boseongicola sp. SB0675_bin_26]|nr:M20/M25/M40 family metallo-hydrolase [Boseongicola sp. SB0675_bin_26]